MTNAARAPLSNLAQRLITATLVDPLVVLAVLAGGVAFTLTVTAVAVLGVIEFYSLASSRPSQGSTLTGVPMLLGVLIAFHLNLGLLAWLVVLAAGALTTFALETLRHHKDVRRSIFQVGMTLLGIVYVGL